MRRRTKGLLAVGTAVLAVGATAGPAAADHLTSGRDGFCLAGPLSLGIPVELTTSDASRTVAADGTVRLLCRFSDVPRYVSAEDSYIGAEWTAPRRPGVFEGVICYDEPTDRYSDGRAISTPGGRLVVECVFAP